MLATAAWLANLCPERGREGEFEPSLDRTTAPPAPNGVRGVGFAAVAVYHFFLSLWLVATGFFVWGEVIIAGVITVYVYYYVFAFVMAKIIYIKNNNNEAFGDAILNLLHDPQKREQMGQFGYERVVHKLSWGIQKQTLNSAYDYLFSKP